MSMSKGPLEKRERLRRLCKRIVAGDGGTRAELQSATMKYVHTQYDDPVQVLKRLYRDEGELGSLLRRAVEVCDGVHKQLDDQEYSPATGAQYPRTRRFLDVSDDDDGDALDRDRDLLGDDADDDDMEKKESPMDTVHSIMKSGGIARTCAAIVAKGTTTLSQDEIVDAVGKVAAERYPGLSEAQAFAKIFEAPTEEGRVLREAINVAKASLAETMLGPGLPVQTVVGPAARNVDTAEEAERARAELIRIGRRQWPRLTEQDAYERAFCDPANATLVAHLYQRPTPTSIYPMPREWLQGEGSQHAKSDRSEGTAYDELMLKAEAYRNAHPELSVAQCFEKIYTDRANVELAKRERIESAPR